MTKKIAFVTAHKHPSTDSVKQVIQDAFPEYKVETIDIIASLKARKQVVLLNIFHILRHYGFDILTKRKRVGETIFKTPYIFHTVKKMISEKIKKGNYLFSIQMHSLYDTSAPGIPHFIYTDNTHFANLKNPNYKKSRLPVKEWLNLERTIYLNAAISFTRSSNVTRSIIEDYSISPEKVICIYAGNNVRINGDAVLNNNNYSNKNILFVATTWENKGGPELVEAYRQVKKIHPDAKLTIVGCSPDINLPDCHVVGKVSLEDLDKYYRKASIFCLPTKQEAFGIVYLEAMRYKLPVIATRLGAIPDFIHEGENGFLIDPDNVEQIKNSLCTLLHSPSLCRKFGMDGYRISMENYTWEEVGRKLRQNIMPFLQLSNNKIYEEEQLKS